MYYLLIIIILLLYNNYKTDDFSIHNIKKENLYCFIICAILVLLAAFRSNHVGTDTLSYRQDYLSLQRFNTFADLLRRHSVDYIGYYGLSKLFQLMNMPVEVWFGFIEAIYLYALMLLVNRFSKDKIFSLLVFITTGLFAFSMAGLKQTLAASFMMYSFILFIDKRYLLAIPLIILTYYTHPAALIFLFVFPAYLLRNSRYLVAFCLISCIAIYFYSTTFIATMIDLLDNAHFQAYNVSESDYSYVTFIFYVTITLLCFMSYRNYKNNKQGSSKFIMGLSMLACGLQMLAGVSPSLFRLANMYVPFMMILLPNTSFYATQDNKKGLRFILMGCIIFYFLYTGRNSPYSFYLI